MAWEKLHFFKDYRNFLALANFGKFFLAYKAMPILRDNDPKVYEFATMIPKDHILIFNKISYFIFITLSTFDDN